MTNPANPAPPGGSGTNGASSKSAAASKGEGAFAAKSEAHAPQRRQQVQDQPSGPSIVVTDDASREAPPELGPYPSSADATVVIRQRRAQTVVLPRAQRKSSAGSVLVWVVAGLIAFGLGGVLALVTSGGGDGEAKQQPEPAAEPVAAAPKAEPAPAPEPEPEPEPEAEPAEDEEEAVDLAELPVEAKQARPVSRPRPRPAAAPQPAPQPKKPTTQPTKAEIPSGI